MKEKTDVASDALHLEHLSCKYVSETPRTIHFCPFLDFFLEPFGDFSTLLKFSQHLHYQPRKHHKEINQPQIQNPSIWPWLVWLWGVCSRGFPLLLLLLLCWALVSVRELWLDRGGGRRLWRGSRQRLMLPLTSHLVRKQRLLFLKVTESPSSSPGSRGRGAFGGTIEMILSLPWMVLILSLITKSTTPLKIF